MGRAVARRDGGRGARRPRRLDASFPSIDFFERRGIPFVIGVNLFDGAPRYTEEELRHALDVDDGVPVVSCDVRRRPSGKDVLVALTEHALALARAQPVPAV